MPRDAPNEFVTHILDLLAPLGPVRARRMFGGHGLFIADAMFAIIDDDTLYLKSDDANRPDFESAGLSAFTYARSDGKLIALSFHQAPDRALDDSAYLCAWSRKSLEAAERALTKRRKPTRRRGAGRH